MFVDDIFVVKFRDAITRGRTDEAIDLLSNNLGPTTYSYQEGLQALWIAMTEMRCAAKCLEILEEYAEYDDDPDSGHEVDDLVSYHCREAFLIGDVALGKVMLDANFYNATEDSLHLACAHGDINRVRAIINNLPETSIISHIEQSAEVGVGDMRPLTTACICGHFDIVRYFVEELIVPADIEALHFACANGRIDIVQYMLQHYKEGLINSIESYYQLSKYNTPLTAACQYGRLEIVKLLISHGESLNIVEYTDYDHLTEACKSGNDQLVRYLLECDPDTCLQQAYHEFPHSACHLCCRLMEELGISILDNFYPIYWEYDIILMSEYDCLMNVEMMQTIKNKLFIKNSFESVSSNQGISVLDFRVFFAEGLEESVTDIRGYQNNGHEFLRRKTAFLHDIKSCDMIWALLEMGLLEQEVLISNEMSNYSNNFLLSYPLYQACLGGDRILLDKLLQIGAGFDWKYLQLVKRDQWFVTALEGLIRNGKEDLEQDIYPLNCTFLMLCCRELLVDGIQVLLKGGAEVTTVTGKSALDILANQVKKTTEKTDPEKAQAITSIFKMLITAAVGAPHHIIHQDQDFCTLKNVMIKNKDLSCDQVLDLLKEYKSRKVAVEWGVSK